MRSSTSPPMKIVRLDCSVPIGSPIISSRVAVPGMALNMLGRSTSLQAALTRTEAVRLGLAAGAHALLTRIPLSACDVAMLPLRRMRRVSAMRGGHMGERCMDDTTTATALPPHRIACAIPLRILARRSRACAQLCHAAMQ